MKVRNLIPDDLFNEEKIPIPKISTNNKKSLETFVNKIIVKKEAGEDTITEEREIDQMVYKLYDLTYEEVKIIEPEFEMSKEEYEKNE